MSTQANTNKKKSNFFIDFCLAGVSAAIGKTVGAPLERVKLILQTQKNLEIVGGQYTGMSNCLFRLVKEEGVYSLWRGNLINVLRYFPNQALSFALKDTFKEYFPKYDSKKQFWKMAFTSCLSGGLAGATALVLLHPIDLARTRLATDNVNKDGIRKFKGTKDCLQQIIKSEGIIGLYRGLMVSITSIFIYRAAYFGGYDTLKTVIKTDNPFVKWGCTQVLLFFTGIFFYPLDTIRRRIMVETGKPYDEKKYKSAIDCIKKTMKSEGGIAFYHGFMTNAIRSGGATMILVLYDEFQNLLGLEARGKSGK